MKTSSTVIKSKKTVLNNKKETKPKSKHFRFPIDIAQWSADCVTQNLQNLVLTIQVGFTSESHGKN